MTKHRVPRIPILEAISIGKPKVSGRNKPIAINCSALGSTRLAEYIVKFYGDIAYQEHSLARELIGSLLALYFGLNTPEPEDVVGLYLLLGKPSQDDPILTKAYENAKEILLQEQVEYTRKLVEEDQIEGFTEEVNSLTKDH